MFHFALVSVLLVSAAGRSVESDDNVCQELRDHAKNLRHLQAEAAPQYARARQCPEALRSRLDVARSSAAEDLLMIYELIDQLWNSLNEGTEPKFCPLKWCRRKNRARRQNEIGLTYAIFYKAGRLFRDNLFISALIEIARLKLIRLDMEGVDMTEVFAIEDALLNELADACDDNPRLVLGVSPRSSPRMIYRVHERLSRLTNPNCTHNNWRSEQETMGITHRVLDYAHSKLQNQEKSDNDHDND